MYLRTKSSLYLSVLAAIAIASTSTNVASAISSSSSPDYHQMHHKQALNLVLTNDDGWAEMNIRAQNDALLEAGHKVCYIIRRSQRPFYLFIF
jgi:outer membrane lipoprotein SlyB